MPDLPRQEPFFGDELEPIIAHQQMPAGTGELDAPNESIGEYLRRNRERTGKALTEISHALKIMSHYLVAIENNSFEELPGRAYAIGFVRSYAAYLGLDAGALVARLKAELTTEDIDPVFATPNTPGRVDQTGIASVENGSAEALSTEACPRLEGGWLSGSAQATRQSHIAKALLRFKGIAKIPRELKLRFPSPADRMEQRDGVPGESGTGREIQLGLFSAAGRRDRPRTAYSENGNAGRPNSALFSSPEALSAEVATGSTLVKTSADQVSRGSPAGAFSVGGSAVKARQLEKTRALRFKANAKSPGRTAPQFSTPARALPLPAPQEHPVRNWITAGIMGAAIIYFGLSMIHSGQVAAPPPVIPVPARMAAEAAFVPEKVVPPAVATLAQPEQGAPEPASVPPSGSKPPTVAAIEKPATGPQDAAIIPPSEAIPAQRDTASAEPKHIFRAQLPLGERYGEQNRGSRITLRVHRPTLVAVLGGRNHKWIDRVLRAGDTYRVPNMRGLKLNARDAGAVEVILDGNTVGFAGGDGAAVKGMSLQPQSIISRFHWLQE